MRARLISDQGNIICEWPIGKKPPKFIRNGRKSPRFIGDYDYFYHCGTLIPENIAIYRVRPFGGGRAMPVKPRNYLGRDLVRESVKLIPFAGREW